MECLGYLLIVHLLFNGSIPFLVEFIVTSLLVIEAAAIDQLSQKGLQATAGYLKITALVGSNLSFAGLADFP